MNVKKYSVIKVDISTRTIYDVRCGDTSLYVNKVVTR